MAHLGGVAVFFGRTDEAQQMLARLAADPHATPYCWIQMYAALGDRARLREWWHKAMEYRDPALPVWKAIAQTWWANNPDFPELLKKMGL